MATNKIEKRTIIYWLLLTWKLTKGAASASLYWLSMFYYSVLKRLHPFSWVLSSRNCRYFRRHPMYWGGFHDYQSKNRRHTDASFYVLLRNQLHSPFYWWSTVLTESFYIFLFRWSGAYIPKLIQHTLQFNFSDSLLSCHDSVYVSRPISNP
jgi:hypothetical protein